MFKLFRRKRKVGCPVCYEKNSVGFGVDYLASNFDSRISVAEEIGNIQVFQCSVCESFFYKKGNIFQRLIDGQIENLKEFTNRELKLSGKLKADLESIGLTPDWSMNMLAPAKVTLKNGESLDFATVRVSKEPPIGYSFSHFAKIIFIDEIEEIEPSKFGISKEIREKAKNAEEMRMGFYPSVLKDSNDNKVVINGQSLFFKSRGIKGADLKLENEVWNHKEKYIYEDKIDNQLLIVAKE